MKIKSDLNIPEILNNILYIYLSYSDYIAAERGVDRWRGL